MMPDYFEKVRPTYIENWGEALTKLSISQTDIPLGPDEVRALGQANRDFGSLSGRAATQPIRLLAERIGAALSDYPTGAFVRLGSRSAKDSRYALSHELRITDAEAAIRMLTEGSQRVVFDLRLALLYNYSPHIFVRQWCDIPAWAELRCFMRSRRLVGISQYDCKNLRHCPEIAENADRIEAAIAAFFKDFCAASHLDDVVFDVFIMINGQHSGKSIDVRLLELNPFFLKTDSCLFHWDKDDFDGSFRYLVADAQFGSPTNGGCVPQSCG